MGTENNNDTTTAAAAAAAVTATLNPNNNKPVKPSSNPEPPTPTTAPPLRSSPNSSTPPTDSKDADVISIPSYSRWFNWDNIHQCELRFLPEFFDGRSASKNPKIYKYYRNAIIQRFRDTPTTTTKKITFTEVRKTIVGDVGSIRRVFDFLEAWGLINYSPSSSSSNKAAPTPQPQPQPQPLKWDDNKDSSSKSAAADAAPTASAAASSADTTAAATTTTTGVPKKRLCSACKSPCTLSCFTSDKHNLTLCGRCYVSNNFRVGITSTDFRRVEISEVVKTDWTDKETLHLLEAIMHYGDDWKKVAEHVGGGRSDRDCVARFLKLPFGDQFVGTPESAEIDHELGLKDSSFPNKRMRLSPLADASNPIMAQAAFLSALAGVEVAEVAAHAAVTALSDSGGGKIKNNIKSVPAGAKELDFDVALSGESTNTVDGALVQALLQVEKEEEDLERALSGKTVQTKELQDKILHFEELDLQVERESQQLQQLKDLLFVDQLKLLFHKSAARKTGESTVESIKVE